MNKDKYLVAPNESFDSYHSRNCTICNRPDRPAIEQEFLHWHSPVFIAREYEIPWRSVYRHAHALGLFAERRRNLRHSLEFIIEDASRTDATPESVIRAVQLYARISDTGELIETPKTQVIVISRDGNKTNPPDVIDAQINEKIDENILRRAADSAAGLPSRNRELDTQLDNRSRTESDLTH
jgi:hypothetical protein